MNLLGLIEIVLTVWFDSHNCGNLYEISFFKILL